MNDTTHLLKRYNKAIPRYTSYPTVPFWKEEMDEDRYTDAFKAGFAAHNPKDGIALYIHLPFCESLCTYCGCNKKITTNHDVEEDYIRSIIGEWYLYRKLMMRTPVIRELHLGGGTPTFFSPKNLERLLLCIFDLASVSPETECSIEGHPNNTTREHLEMLHRLGFNRISLGVQDHNPEVQRIINRIQPYENVRRVTAEARENGFKSVNFDLIYGLPRQTLSSIEKTVKDTIALRPDRIAFYSYAHIPWKMKAQRLYDENDLPSSEMKLQFYILARELFLAAGYVDIGMDHFALPGDDLYHAFQNGTLHRNFMGYTTCRSRFLIGLGVSAISDIGPAYMQNHKELTAYYRRVNEEAFPFYRGYFLDETEVAFRNYILEIACLGKTTFKREHRELLDNIVFPALSGLASDGLISLSDHGLVIEQHGRLFLRNVCQAFDLKWHLSKKEDNESLFSKAI